jgi:hypothetical protein
VDNAGLDREAACAVSVRDIRERRMNASELWHRLLLEDKGAYLEGLPAFREQLFRAGVRFGERPLCNHLRPKFLTTAEEAHLRAVSNAVLDGIMEAKDRLLEDPALLEMLGIRADERPLIDIDPGYSHIAPCVRLDSFITDRGPQFVELNGECPAGPAYCEVLAESFETHPLMKRFKKERPARYVHTREPLLATLLACWAEWGGTRKPVIAIIDYDNLPTIHEFELCRQYFESRGYTTVVADPRTVEYQNGDLVAGGKKIDLVYRRVLVNEFLERYDQVKALHLAYRDRAVCMVNPFRSKLVHKKAIFAVLTSDGRDEWLSPANRDLIDRAVPWTRLVKESKTRFEGREIDLVPFIAAHRDDLVLKPNDEYGGKGVALGWECDQSTWETKIAEALAEPFVVQKRLRLIPEKFPSMVRDLEEDTLFVDLDPYMYLGKMQGALARLGAGGLCNVTSGGGQAPMFIAD